MNRKSDRLLQRTIAVLERHGHKVSAIATTGPNTAAKLARECIHTGADLILAAGGDGTINEVLNGMVHSDVPLGILPAGTANVLACELKMGTKMIAAAECLSRFVPHRIALGHVESEATPAGRHFVLMAGAGLDAMIVYNINARLKAAIGKVAYWIGGFSQVGRRLAEFDVVADGRTISCSFALTSRVKNYGGDLNIARGASLLDDDFELVLFQGPGTLPYLRYFAGVLTNRASKMKGVVIMKARDVQLKPASDPRVYLQIDGEYVGRTPARLRVVPDALNLLVPPEFVAPVNG